MIDLTDPKLRGLLSELRTVVLRISMISHAPTQGFNLAPPPENLPKAQRWRTSARNDPVPHIGSHTPKSADTQIPRGRIDRRDDLNAGFPQKSHLYFQHTLTRWERSAHAYTVVDMEELLAQANEALERWMKTPQMAGVELERDSFLWKCEVADSDDPIKSIAKKYSISHATIYRYRSTYRGLRASWNRAA